MLGSSYSDTMKEIWIRICGDKVEIMPLLMMNSVNAWVTQIQRDNTLYIRSTRDKVAKS